MSLLFMVFFFRKKTAYELRISVWSSDVCSSDLAGDFDRRRGLRKLAVRCGERRLCGDALAVDLVDLGAHRIDALRRRSGAAADEADVRRLERRAPRLDLAPRLFAVGDLRVEEFQPLARVDPAPAQLVVAKHGYQAVEPDRGELSIVGVGQAADPDARGDFEDIVLLPHHLDILDRKSTRLNS